MYVYLRKQRSRMGTPIQYEEEERIKEGDGIMLKRINKWWSSNNNWKRRRRKGSNKRGKENRKRRNRRTGSIKNRRKNKEDVMKGEMNKIRRGI